MESVSILLKGGFIVITIATVWQFYRASGKSKVFRGIIAGWMVIQLALALSNFFTATTVPPPIMLAILPPVIMIITMFISKAGRAFMDKLSIKELTLLHSIRIFVEIILYYLFISKAVPGIMTFEGRNFDVFAGLTAPFVYYFGFIKNKLSNGLLIAWNLICLGLLLNVFLIAVLSLKGPLQHFGFEQPNIAIGYFPFNWLPSVVVPLVLFAHLATLRKLLLNRENQKDHYLTE